MLDVHRVLKVSFGKSGRGTLSPKISLPISFLNDMQISKENRNIEVFYDIIKKEIIMRKI